MSIVIDSYPIVFCEKKECEHYRYCNQTKVDCDKKIKPQLKVVEDGGVIKRICISYKQPDIKPEEED